jgi:hypothetical protein
MQSPSTISRGDQRRRLQDLVLLGIYPAATLPEFPWVLVTALTCQPDGFGIIHRKHHIRIVDMGALPIENVDAIARHCFSPDPDKPAGSSLTIS